ncbi:MAG: N-acetylmuramoyl-L-alanine amidase, partial [Bacteroidota bacterium]
NDYPLAAANARKGAYNLGVDYLHRFLDSDFDDRLALQEAKNIFNEAEGQQRSAISRKVLHGLGLVNFYDGAVSEAISYRDQLLKRSELYFDTLSTYPHLDALLRPELYQVETITPIRDPRCYQITNAGEAGLSFFNRPLSQKEMDELSQNNTPSRSNRNNQTQQVLSTLADSTEVRLLGESQSFYRIRVQEQTGYILKDNDGTTIVLCPEKSVVEVSPSYRAPSLSSFGAPIKRPRYLWCLDNAEGALQAGKRSPVLEDGRQFFEYEFSRDIVRRIINRLDRLGVEYFNVVPEVEVDAFLQERVERINQKASSLPKVVISINSNTLTVGKQQWNPALSGIEVWHSHNSVSGKQVAEVFANQLVRATGWKNRGAKSREKDRFYILRRANATTIITENGFYSNEEQTLELLSDSTRQKIADAHVRAILELERNGIPGIEATTTAPTTTSDDTNQNTATNDPEEEANTPTNDTDQDGIPNDKDQCPEEAGDLPNGCTNQITFSVLLSDSGEPAIGTIVIVRGTSLGTILDSDENTSIEGVSRDSRLVFSYTGYETQELSLSQMVDQDYTITLTPSATLETELQKRLKALQLDEPIRIYFDEDRPREGKIIERIDQLFTEYLSRRDIYKQYNKDAEEVDQFFDEMETNNDLLNKGAVGKAIVAALEAGKQVEMRAEAYTSSQGSQRYNNALADRMLRSFTNAVENGNLKQYIDAGQLKITTINRGESGTSAGKVTNPKEANNAYSITRARERRIEITSIEVSDPPRKKGRK